MKRALKILGKFILGLVFLGLALIFALLGATSMFLNTKTLDFAMNRFGKSYQPKWKELELNVGGGFLTKRVAFHAAGLCFDEIHDAMTGCFSTLDLDATIHLGMRPLLSVRKLDRLVIRSEAFKLDETAQAPEAKKSAQKAHSHTQLPQLLPAPVRTMTIGVLDVRIPRLTVVSSSGTATVKLAATFTAADQKPMAVDAYVVVKGTAPDMIQHYTANLVFDSDLFREGKLSYLRAKAKVQGDKAMKADLSAKIEQAGDQELRLRAQLSAQIAGKVVEARLDGTQGPALYAFTASLSAEDPAGPLRRAALADCGFKAPLKKNTSQPLSIDLKCGIMVEPAPSGKSKARILTGALAAHADFKARILKLQHDYFESDIKVTLGPSGDFHSFTADLQAKLAGRTGDFPRNITARHEFQAAVKIAKFDELVTFLDGTDYAIPAPLNALKGPISFSAETTGGVSGRKQDVSYRLLTDLASAKQSIQTKSSGKISIRHLFEPGQAVSDVTDVDLQKIALELPYLKVGAAPAPIVDKRIKTGDAKRDAAAETERQVVRQPRAPSTADYDIHVHSSSPVIIASNLLKEPMPVSLDIRAKADGMGGLIRIEPFNMEVFRQVGHVDHITFKPNPSGGSMPLDGKVVYKKNDATVNILLLGSVDKPTIAFESDPPMTQSEIVGLLLYGKSPAELDSDQAASAGNASAAMSNGALGLVSLYLFASTPIDSVGYDAATQTYQIRFKLPGGATLAVGSNAKESQTLSLRKRVAKDIELETQMGRGQGQERNVLTTFLQWFKRY